MRSMSSKIIFFIVLIAQKYLGKVDLWGALRFDKHADFRRIIINLGCRDGAVVRAVASHQCGPGSIPRLGIICGMSFFFPYSAPRGFLSVLWFPLPSKTNI